MSYQPPVIGSKQLLNFHATSWPDIGGWILDRLARLRAGRGGAWSGGAHARHARGDSRSAGRSPRRRRDAAGGAEARWVAQCSRSCSALPGRRARGESSWRPGGPVPTLTAALRLARAGDTVVVTAGIYREPQIVVTVPVVILGEGAAVLDGGGTHEVLTLRADGVTVRGLTVRNVGRQLHRGSGGDPDRWRPPLRRGRQSPARHVLRDLRRACFGLPDRGESDRGTRPPAGCRGKRHPPVQLGRLHREAQPDPRAPGRDLSGVLPSGHDRRQREPRQPALRPPLHVLRQLRVPPQRVRGATAPAWR